MQLRVRRRRKRTPRVLIIVQNLSVPLDRRVWQECLALLSHGYAVSVICPRGPGEASRETLQGVDIHRYRPPPQTHGTFSFLIEFSYCWLRTMWSALRIAATRGIDAVQACNPPDTFFPLGIVAGLFGVPYVFDQHDLSPEMYTSRFRRSDGLLLRALYWLERATYRTADHVITTNESYAEIVRARGRKVEDEVTVVRSAPDTTKLRRVPADPTLRAGRKYLVVWLGIMGPQDGVDLALRAAHHYVHVLGRTDCQFAFLGFGDAMDELRRLAGELDLSEYVTFTGRVGPDEIGAWFSSASLGLVPDEKTPYADLSTHNKTMEYMAFSLPVVTFDLKETRFSAGAAAQVVPADDTAAMAVAIADLLDDPDLRARMGRAGCERLHNELEWRHQAPRYVGVYDRLLKS